MNNFNRWWASIGSGITPTTKDDYETHSKKVAIAAWSCSIDIDKKECIEAFIDFLNIPPDVVTPSFLQTKLIDFLKVNK